MTPLIRVMCQTMLDAHSRQRTNTTVRKGTDARGLDSAKDSGKQKKVKCQDLHMALEGEPPEEVNLDTARAPKHTILSIVEGWAFLEEEALINLDKGLDLDIIGGALIQISLMKGMPAAAGYAVHWRSTMWNREE